MSTNKRMSYYLISVRKLYGFYPERLFKPNNNNDIIMDGNILTKVNSAKYLGVIIDHKLNCIDYIAYVKNKISKGIGII